jgi:hypothetical protein
MVRVELLMAPGWGWRMLRPHSSIFARLKSRGEGRVRTLDVPEGALLINFQVEGIQPPRFCFYFLATEDGLKGIFYDEFIEELLGRTGILNSARVIGVSDSNAGFSVRVKGFGRLDLWLPKHKLPDELMMKVAEFKRRQGLEMEEGKRRRELRLALMREARRRSEELLRAFLDRFPEVKEIQLGRRRALAVGDFIITPNEVYHQGVEICVQVHDQDGALTAVDRMIAKAIALMKMPEKIMAEAARYQEEPRERATTSVGDIVLDAEVDLVNMEFIVTLDRDRVPNPHEVAFVIENATRSAVIVEGSRLRIIPRAQAMHHLRRVAEMVMGIPLDYPH